MNYCSFAIHCLSLVVKSVSNLNNNELWCYLDSGSGEVQRAIRSCRLQTGLLNLNLATALEIRPSARKVFILWLWNVHLMMSPSLSLPSNSERKGDNIKGLPLMLQDVKCLFL